MKISYDIMEFPASFSGMRTYTTSNLEMVSIADKLWNMLSKVNMYFYLGEYTSFYLGYSYSSVYAVT